MSENLTLEDAEIFFSFLSFIAPVSQQLRDRFGSLMRKERYPKSHLLLRPGEVARRIYFIKSGFARSYYTEQDGRVHTRWFMGPLDIMISVFSFYTQQPAAEYLEVLEDSEMFTMSFDQLQLVYAEHPEFNYFGRLVTEKYYIRAEERQILLRTKKPAERYELLLKSHPNILNQAPLGIIASFLGIEKETLSRIRNPKRHPIDPNQKMHHEK